MKILQESFGSIRDIIINNDQQYLISIYNRTDQNMRYHRRYGQFIAIAPRYLIEAIGLIGIISICLISIRFSSKSFSEIFPVLGFIALGLQKLLPAMHVVYTNWSTYLQNQSSLRLIISLFDENVIEEGKEIIKESISFKNRMIFENVSFNYSNIRTNKNVINNINLHIKKGEMIGIRGPTGSGKSTFIDLVIGLIEPSEGQITFDGQILNSKNRRQWRKLISHVPQSIFLLDSTIVENIALGVPRSEYDFNRIEKCLRIAQLTQFIDSSNHGLDTKVGETGIRLSGGQRQRIGIARALYKNSQILILDEATSALDNHTEKNLIEAIADISREITIIMVAHRLSTLKKCNRIFNIKNGSLISDENASELKIY